MWKQFWVQAASRANTVVCSQEASFELASVAQCSCVQASATSSSSMLVSWLHTTVFSLLALYTAASIELAAVGS